MNRARTVFWIHAVADSVLVLTILCVFPGALVLRIDAAAWVAWGGLLALFMLVPLGLAAEWAVGGLRRPRPLPRLDTWFAASRLFLVLAWIPAASASALWLALLWRYDHQSKRYELPSGHVLVDDSFVTLGDRSRRHSRYTLESPGGSVREEIGRSTREAPEAEGRLEPRLFRAGDLLTVVIDGEVWTRWSPESGWSVWHARFVGLGGSDLCFLRSLSSSEDYLSEVDYYSSRERQRSSRYAVDRVELELGLLYLRADEEVDPWPRQLVYSTGRYGVGWELDERLTREANGLPGPVPFPRGARVELFLVTVPHEVWNRNVMEIKTYGRVVTLPGVRRLPVAELPLTEEPREVKISIVTPEGEAVDQTHTLRGAWGTSEEGVVGVAWDRKCLFLSEAIPKRVDSAPLAGRYGFVYAKLSATESPSAVSRAHGGP